MKPRLVWTIAFFLIAVLLFVVYYFSRTILPTLTDTTYRDLLLGFAVFAGVLGVVSAIIQIVQALPKPDEKGETYRLHLSSMDWQHGFSLQPNNINLQVHPGYDMVVTLTPTETGTFSVVCNEYCGVGHHTMVGKIHVVEPGQGG